MSHHGRTLAIGVVACVAAAPLAAQAPVPHASLSGVVRDSSGTPIPGAEVFVRGWNVGTTTLESGGFRLPVVPVGDITVRVRRLGFTEATAALKLANGQNDSLVFSLSPLAANLPTVAVEESEAHIKRMLAGFWERKSRGFGYFITREDIERGTPLDFTDIVRRTPGLRIMSVGGRNIIRFNRHVSVRGDCPPQYYVDGMRVENATPDFFPPADVEAIELYSSSATTPPQFAPKASSVVAPTCGVIVVWTRVPG